MADTWCSTVFDDTLVHGQHYLDTITLLSAKQVADAVGRSVETLNEWCRKGTFPRPMQSVPGGPKQWRLSTVKAWIEKRQRARYLAPLAGRIRRRHRRTPQ